jgi:hypothetical protein
LGSSSLLGDYLINDPRFQSQPGCALPALKHPFPIPYQDLEIVDNPKRKSNKIFTLKPEDIIRARQNE